MTPCFILIYVTEVIRFPKALISTVSFFYAAAHIVFRYVCLANKTKTWKFNGIKWTPKLCLSPLYGSFFSKLWTRLWLVHTGVFTYLADEIPPAWTRLESDRVKTAVGLQPLPSDAFLKMSFKPEFLLLRSSETKNCPVTITPMEWSKLLTTARANL